MSNQPAARLTRRLFLAGAPLALSACVSRSPGGSFLRFIDPRLMSMYGAVSGEPHPVPAIDVSEVDPRYLRQYVAYRGPEAPGTIVVDPTNRFLYLVQGGGEAIRYGCGVGRAGFSYRGAAIIGRKAEWPHWTPTPNMIELMPDRYGDYRAGLKGGINNPLGARALYLYKGGRDTYFRIHGTNEPESIGKQVSSGCIRLFNQDVIDLYRRVPVGTPVVVLPAGARPRSDGGSS